MIKMVTTWCMMTRWSPAHMVDDDPMRDDHHKHWESPHHHRVEYEVCKLLKIVTLIIISIIREYLKKVSVKVKVTSPKIVAKKVWLFRVSLGGHVDLQNACPEWLLTFTTYLESWCVREKLLIAVFKQIKKQNVTLTVSSCCKKSVIGKFLSNLFFADSNRVALPETSSWHLHFF